LFDVGAAHGAPQAIALAASGDNLIFGLPPSDVRRMAVLSIEETALNDDGDIAALANGGETQANAESVVPVDGVKAPVVNAPVLTTADGVTVGVILTNAGAGGDPAAAVRVISVDTFVGH
jgi:hypothetical protein